MGWWRTLVYLGNFEEKIQLQEGVCTSEDVVEVINNPKGHHYLEKLYILYVTSFGHYLDKDGIRNGLIVVKTKNKIILFMYSILLLYYMLILLKMFSGGVLFGDLIGIIICPLLIFGIPTGLGWLYFEWCKKKIYAFLSF